MLKKLINNNERGFTLILLMVVLVFIVMLAAIAVPSFAKSGSRVNDPVAMAIAQDFNTAVQGYYIDHPNVNISKFSSTVGLPGLI